MAATIQNQHVRVGSHQKAAWVRCAAALVSVFVLLLAPPAAAAPTAARGTTIACPRDLVPSREFDDTAASLFALEIDCIVWWSIASGRTDRSYEPTVEITRAQMATFLVNLVVQAGGDLPVTPPDVFTDDEASAHQVNINRLAASGLVTGKSVGIYGPSDPVTRAQMATFLVRAHEHLNGGAPMPAGSDYFTDDADSTHQDSINKLAEAGITSGTATGAYEPGGAVRRDQMAAFVARTLDLLVANGHATLPPPTSAGPLDFANRTYLVDCTDGPEPIRLVDGEWQRDEDLRNGNISGVNVEFADITPTPGNEAVVTLSCAAGASTIITQTYVFERPLNGGRQFGQPIYGYPVQISTDINGGIEVWNPIYFDGSPLCCPDAYEKQTWAAVGNDLAAVATETVSPNDVPFPDFEDEA